MLYIEFVRQCEDCDHKLLECNVGVQFLEQHRFMAAIHKNCSEDTLGNPYTEAWWSLWRCPIKISHWEPEKFISCRHFFSPRMCLSTSVHPDLLRMSHAVVTSGLFLQIDTRRCGRVACRGMEKFQRCSNRLEVRSTGDMFYFGSLFILSMGFGECH